MKSFALLAWVVISNIIVQVHPAPVQPALRAATPKFAYGTTKVRGVNLGGWFVLEPWITPSLFESLNGAAVDEWSFCASLGATEARNRLTNHWNTWITQADFAAIAGAGLNHVRIPIGYWAIAPLQGEPYVQGAYDKLGEALDWAQGVGLKVLIDLHGAPGSQNGFDNSGRFGGIKWTQGTTVQQTRNALAKIRNDHANHPAVAAIELLNEPMGPRLDMNVVRGFYSDGAGSLQGSPVVTAFHDAFMGVTSWNGWGNNFKNLLLDTHHYEVFTLGDLEHSPQDHIGTACAFGRRMASNNKITISGEWTGAMTDCAKYLNGYGKGARFDNTFEEGGNVGSCAAWTTGSIASLPADQRDSTGRFVEAQLDAFEMAGGWIFWTWKTEGAPGWDLGDLLRNGVFPQPIESRKYPGQCG